MFISCKSEGRDARSILFINISFGKKQTKNSTIRTTLANVEKLPVNVSIHTNLTYRGAWLHRRSTGQRSDHVTSGFRLPECVHDATLSMADDIVQPEPSFWVNWLSN